MAKMLMALLMIGLAASSFYSIWELYELNKLPAGTHIEDISELNEQFELATAVNNFFRVLIIVIRILVAITFIQWSRRAYWNMHHANAPGLSYSEGWAAGSWFVPLGNLYLPYKILVDIKRSLIFFKSGEESFNQKAINYWWIGFVMFSVFNRVARWFFKNTASIEDMVAGETFYLLSVVSGAISAYFAVKMISGMAKLESQVYWTLEEKHRNEMTSAST